MMPHDEEDRDVLPPPMDRVCPICHRKHWGFTEVCARCEELTQREQRWNNSFPGEVHTVNNEEIHRPIQVRPTPYMLHIAEQAAMALIAAGYDIEDIATKAWKLADDMGREADERAGYVVAKA